MVNILLATITNILILFETFHGKGTSEENVVFGPAQLVVEDVPLPIAVPFGFFPFNSSYSSGFIMPTYGDEMNRGFICATVVIILPSATRWT